MLQRLSTLGRQLWVLLSGILLVHLGHYILLPYLPVLLTKRGLTAAYVGAVLGSGSVAYLTASLAGGLLADRFGRKTVMLGGLLLRISGYLSYIAAGAGPWLFGASLLVGLGGGLYMPPVKAGIAAEATRATRQTAFSLRGVTANVGVTIGPLLGALLVGQHGWLFAAAAAAHGLLLVITWVGLDLDRRPKGPATASAPQSTGTSLASRAPGGVAGRPLRATTVAATAPAKTDWLAAFRTTLANKPYLAFSLLTVLVWALYTQLTLALPLKAASLLPGGRAIGLIWTLTSVEIIVLQLFISRWTERWHPLIRLAVGTVLLGLGLGSVAFAVSFLHLLGSATIFTVGEMLVMPTVDTVVSVLSKGAALGTFYGVAAFTFGLGEAGGNSLGGLLLTWARVHQRPQLPWFLYAALGLMLGLGFALLAAWPRMTQALGRRDSRLQTAVPPVPERRKNRI